ncbi:hypothetical protein Peur_060608 [Populus x canadensis]|jgi:hypothetical protein|uniref:Uncharacterized protein n=1 Tax=Populus deltoides TaxID=3696 RepID=A0A8T2XQK8_POPDE|nr:hypothetical protein H0E87_021195 [Populus deltoides]
MAPPEHKPTSEGDKNKLLDREVRDMVDVITNRIAGLQSQESSADEDDHGIRIITLAGTNTGATMRSELDDQKGKKLPDGESFGEPEASGTYVNSNFQALNNSIMFGSHYNTNDPGVHMDISDTFEPHGLKPGKHGKKGKKKDKGLKEENHSDHSD